MMAQEALLALVEVNQAAIEEIGADASIQHANDDHEAATEDEAALKKRRDVLRFYRPLHDAALNGVWEDVDKFLNEKPDAKITQVNRYGMTVLHLAANMGHAVFIKKLIQSGFFPKEAMRLLDDDGWSALHYAAASRSLSAVKLLVSEDDDSLTQVMSESDHSALMAAANVADNKRVVWYLTNTTINHNLPSIDRLHFVSAKRAFLVSALLDGGHYELANDSIDNWQLGLSYNLLRGLIQRTDFPSGTSLNFWEKCIYHFIPIEIPTSIIRSDCSEASPPQQISTIRSKFDRVIHSISRVSSKATEYVPSFKRIRDVKYNHKCMTLLLEIACKAMLPWDDEHFLTYFFNSRIHYYATKWGQTEILTALIKHFPDAMNNCSTQTDILLYAIENRQEHVYNLMTGRGATTRFLPTYANEEARENIMHAAARLAPYTRLSSVSSPALQMQRELQWFQAVEKFATPFMTISTNVKEEIPRQLFTNQHKELVKDAEKWMKDTSNSCLIVATLILTVVFAAAFTIPGGNIDGVGIPLFLRRNDFLVFIFADAIGMFSAATSILMFLSILTARYAEDDFLLALPKRLILGLASLLIALASMMVAFGLALYIALHPRFNWIIFPIVGITCIPVGIFVMLQLPLFIYMVRSTYGSSLLKVH